MRRARRILSPVALFLLVLLFPTASALADWQVVFDGTRRLSDTMGNRVCQASDGGFVLSGTEWGEEYINLLRIQMIKTDKDGKILWERLFGSGGNDALFQSSGMERTVPDGGYIISGTIQLDAATSIYLIKTDSNGQTLWNKTFETGQYVWSDDVDQTMDNGFIIAGTLSTTDDMFLIKTDSDGNKEWETIFDSVDKESSRSVRQTADGGYIILGNRHFYTGSDIYLIKTDSAGAKEWEKTFGGTGRNEGRCVRQTSDGGYIITGNVDPLDDPNFCLIKTDSDGNQQWQKIYGNSRWSIGKSVEQTSDGGYIVTGEGHIEPSLTEIWIIKTDAEGNEEWRKTYGSTYDDYGDCVIQTDDGGYAVTGVTFEERQWKATLIKVEPTDLYQVRLVAPSDQSVLTSPPIFDWVPSGGIDNAFAIDFAVPPWVPFWSTHENMHQVISETAWTIPLPMWNKIPSGKRIYWRVRGADLDRTPLIVIPSDETWSFYKQ